MRTLTLALTLTPTQAPFNSPGTPMLNAQQLGSLVWDEPALLAASKIALCLHDGDTIVLRDVMHPAPVPSSGGRPSRRVVLHVEEGEAAEEGAAFRPRRAGAGVQIRGPPRFAEA